MKRRLAFLFSITLLSFFLVAGLSAQDQQKVVKKAKTEEVKKEIPKKCLTCPNYEKCHGKAATTTKCCTTAKEGEACCTGEEAEKCTEKNKKEIKVAKK